jgi:predicted anti-sigma-YlaC factor YlaD
MNHKQFESWILDEPKLSDSQKMVLQGHLAACPKCKQLDTGWQASKELMKQAATKAPEPGFSMRWQAFAEKKCQMKIVRRQRISILIALLAVFALSLTYMVASGSFLHMLADIFSSATSLVIGLTKGLSSIGYWLNHQSFVIPLTIGFIFFGLINAFILVGLFTVWNIKQRKLQTDEIKTD